MGHSSTRKTSNAQTAKRRAFHDERQVLRRGLRVPPMSDSYRQAVEDFRLWSENISAREEDCKNGRTPRERYEPRKC